MSGARRVLLIAVVLVLRSAADAEEPDEAGLEASLAEPVQTLVNPWATTSSMAEVSAHL